MEKIEYLLKYHELYYQRIQQLKSRVKELKEHLSPAEFRHHETVKLSGRIRGAEKEIADNPNRPDYLLREELRKFRRYKRGLGRYRIIFCFSNNPPIILFLYLNTEESLRKGGGRRDPYEEFKSILRRGHVSNDPGDPKIQKWIVKHTQ
ncbi:MAG: type II toxin-antitoxin system YhaV family toxin [Elusimicrobia bacterium]|nr:type II toxin-antitoxin system YhaV family toxin [Elusimicrobiota bacterium]